MKLKQLVMSGVVAAAALTAPVAHAAFVIGSASVLGFFQNNTTALGVPTSIVSQLTAFDVLGSITVGATSGNLMPNAAGTSFDFSILTVPQTIFAFNGFTFVVTDFDPPSTQAFNCATVANSVQCADSIAFNSRGIVTGNGFQATVFTLNFSAQGTCNESTTTSGQCGPDATASFSASLSATGADALRVPEPATLGLVGFALLGAGFASRRRA